MAPTFILLIFVHLLTIFIDNCSGEALPKFSAILVFGDSTVDAGNNNYIPTLFKGNHPPYGQDFPGHVPTGRFSNGKLVPDFIASALGIKELVPPFLDPHISDGELCTGISFASGGSGYDDLTTAASGVIPVSKQIKYFKNYIDRLKRIAGDEESKKIIRRALVIVSAGTNDFTFNFYDVVTRKLEFNITGYQDFLLKRVQDFIEELYSSGCRMITVAGLPPTGCLPLQITLKSKGKLDRKCLEDENSDAQIYNYKLAKLLPQLQATLPGSKIIYMDIYKPLTDMIMYPQKYGFVETKKGCCGTGILEAGPLCNSLTPVCEKVSEFLFWDSVHPSQSTSQLLAKYLEKEVFPELCLKSTTEFHSN